MTAKLPAYATDQDSPFSGYLLPLTEAIPGNLFDEAALPSLHSLSNAGAATASRAFHLVCQSGHLIVLSGPAITDILSSRHWLSLIYVERGQLELLHPQHQCICDAGTWVLVPECSLEWKSTAFRVICVLMSSAEIVQSLENYRPDAQWSTSSVLPEWPLVFHSSTTNVSCIVLRMLTKLLSSASQLYGYDPALLDQLAIGDQIRRLLTVLIDLRANRPPSPVSNQQKYDYENDYFDSILDYIKANLGQPLNLTVLANQSHYSLRSLQYAFRNRLGCTATQWIRSQRLDLAWQMLHTAGSGDNVTKIAQACGYRSLSLFSIEFQHRFHIKPSVILRGTCERQGLHGPTQADSEHHA
jgi:AraC-like DNA-binding protein